ncbi:CotH kinase family protein [Aquimarina algicola]|nr:CotH kinase family protein [Aquimarina algicola]
MLKQYITSFLLFICFSFVFGQEVTQVIARKESFGIDQKNKIIIWNFKVTDSTKRAHKKYTQVLFSKLCQKTILTDSLSYKNSYLIQNNNEVYKLYISRLPIISISIDDTIKDIPKKAARFRYSSYKKIIDTLAGIELRGNLSLTFPKKSYDLEFWSDSTKKNPLRIKLPKLGTNDDWILDGLYNEPLRLRSFLSQKLWLSIHKSHYVNKEPKAKSGADLRFVELFLNSEYKGFYALSQQVDRDLLKLKRFENEVVKGELFKATSYEGAPAYKKLPQFNNLFPHWGGYQIKYPFIEYKAYWDNLYKFTDFVMNSNASDFNEKIAEYFNIPNAIDYFLLINLLRATDNLGKNVFVARYDQNTPYFNVPWDLDGVLGTIQDGKRIPTTDDILSNGLFDRLLNENPANYKTRVKNRWLELRNNQFNKDSLFKTIDQTYNRLEKNKIYERENLVWESNISYKDHLEYLKNWVIKRLIYLDTYFNSL